MTESEKILIGIDLGGTNIKVVILDPKLQILNEETFQTRDSNDKPGLWKQKIEEVVRQYKAQFTGYELKCGIAAPGLADEGSTRINYMPGRLSGLEGLHWQEYLALPTRVINDAQAACLSEWKLGAAQGRKHVLMLTLGTGVGGAVILDSKLHQGSIGRAGHLGHISLDFAGMNTPTEMVGSLESAIGDHYLAARTKGHYHSTADLVQDYLQGKPKATYWWLHSLNLLAIGICSMINAFSPEIIVIGGGIAESNEALFKPLQEFIELYEWRPGGYQTEIKKAEMGKYAGAIGAAIFADL